MPFRKGRALRMRCITHSNCAEFHSYSFVIYRLSRKVTRKRVRAAAAGHVIVSETHALIAWNVSIQRGILVLVVSFNSRIFPLKLGHSLLFFCALGDQHDTVAKLRERKNWGGETFFLFAPPRRRSVRLEFAFLLVFLDSSDQSQVFPSCSFLLWWIDSICVCVCALLLPNGGAQMTNMR